MVDGRTAVHAGIGGLVGASLVIFGGPSTALGPFLGGLAAGYLEGGTDVDRFVVGLGVGALTFALLVLVVEVLDAAVNPEANPVLAVNAFVVQALLQFPPFVILALGILPVAGAWVGGYVRVDVLG